MKIDFEQHEIYAIRSEINLGIERLKSEIEKLKQERPTMYEVIIEGLEITMKTYNNILDKIK